VCCAFQFDWAINDRIDEMVEFSLPGKRERLRMLVHYMHELLVAPSEARAIKVGARLIPPRAGVFLTAVLFSFAGQLLQI